MVMLNLIVRFLVDFGLKLPGVVLIEQILVASQVSENSSRFIGVESTLLYRRTAIVTMQ